jgi:hypothetical protein
MNDAKNWENALPTLQWLQGLLANDRDYHNHKEHRAWTATAAFVAVIGGLITATPKVVVEHRYLSIAILVAGTISVLCFIRMQFEMRWFVCDRVDALTRVINYICENPSRAHRVHVVAKGSDAEGFFYIDGADEPKTSQNRGFRATMSNMFRVLLIVPWISLGKDSNRKKDGKKEETSRYCLIDTLIGFILTPMDDRWKTEASSYLIVLLAASIGIVQIWFSNCEMTDAQFLKAIKKDTATMATTLQTASSRIEQILVSHRERTDVQFLKAIQKDTATMATTLQELAASVHRLLEDRHVAVRDSAGQNAGTTGDAKDGK